MLSLTGIELLGHSRKSKFFGDSLRYATEDNYVLNGKILDLYNTSGVGGILKQLSGQNVSAVDFDFLYVNNTYLGLARIDSISYDGGNDVKYKNYTINATVYNTGNIYNLNISDNLYSGVSLDNPLYPVYLIEEFSENFSTSILSDGGYQESQQIKLRYVSGAAIGTILNPITMARQFASNLINSNPAIGFIDSTYSGYRRKPGKRTKNESVDLINNDVEITENFSLINSSTGTYALSYTNSLQIGENGITVVREEGRVQGLLADNYGNYYNSAVSGIQYEVVSNCFNRCNSLYQSFNPEYSTSYPLSSKRLIFGQTLNKYSDIAEYNVEYSNDPRVNNTYIWEYTHELNKSDDGCVYNVSENGDIVGLSNICSPIDKYSNALSAYSTIKTGIEDRCLTFYQDLTSLGSSLKLINKSETKSAIQGTISYNQTYTDDLLFQNNDFKKIEYSIDNNYSVPLINIFDVSNFKQIAQPANIMTMAKQDISLNILGFRGTELNEYLDYCIDFLNSNIPTGTDPFINSCSYSLNPRDNKFSLNCSWAYQQNINLTNYLLN